MTETQDVTVHPSHACFDRAVEFLVAKAIEEPGETYLLVHGICLAPDGPRAGQPFAHAWVEHPERRTVIADGVVDGEPIWFEVGRDEYYGDILRVRECTRYTMGDAIEAERAAGRPGPWKPEYIALCGSDRTVFSTGASDAD